MKLLNHMPALALALFLGASLHAATVPSAVQAQLDAQPTLRANTQNVSVTVVGQNLTVYGGAFFHRNFTDTTAYPTPQYVAALIDSGGAVVAQFALAADGSHRAALGAANPVADDGQTVSQITAQGDVQTFVWTLPIASGTYSLVSTSLELPDSNNVVLAAQAYGVALAPTAMDMPTSNGKMMTASVLITDQPPQIPFAATPQTGIMITAGGSFVFNGSATFFTFASGSNPPTWVAFSSFRADLYTSSGGLVASYVADANGGFSCTMGTTAGSTFTTNSGGGDSALQWTIQSGLAPGSYTLKITTGQNMAVDSNSGSSTTCVTAGGGNGTGVNASGLAINYSTTKPGVSISATPTSLMKGLNVTVKPSYYSASAAVLTGSTGSGISTITNPSTSVQATTSVVDAHVTYTLTAYGTAGLSWPHLQSFDKIYLNGGSYSSTDVSTLNSISSVTLGTTYYLVYKQTGTGVTLTSNSVTPSTSVAQSNFASTQVNSGPSSATIKTNPSDIGTTVGNTVTFTGRTEGFPPPSVQWQISTNGGSSWSNLNSGGPYVITSAPGSDTTKGWNDTTLKVQNATLAMNGYKFQFIGTDADGPATSRPVTLTVDVAPPPGSDIPAMPPLALGGMAAVLMAAAYKFLPKKRND